jgi:uncharacterized repeat protein (TIGR01451 family)
MKKILFTSLCLLISLKGISQTSINITFADDSIVWYGCPAGAPPIFDEYSLIANVNGYSLTDTFTVKAFFGDGTYQTWPIYYPYGVWQTGNQLQVFGGFDHTYLSTGNFDVTYIVIGPDGNSDTLFHPADVILSNNCSSLITYTFIDNNSNCIYDAGDVLLNNIPVTLMNGVSYYNSGFAGNIASGVNYTAFIDASAVQLLGYSVSCPVSGFINFTSSGADTLYFAFNCNSNYDVAVTSSGNPFKIGNSVFMQVAVNDISCIPVSGTYTLNLDPQMTFVTALNAPSSGGGLTYNWNYSNLTNGQGTVSNMMYCNLNSSVQIGDTLCYSFTVTPTAGDINPVNNTVNLCYPVKAAWDPNYKDVFPKGEGLNGYIAPNTKLTYTIGFQNTGNDTAENVYIMDTLDNDVDINTMRIVYASHPMQFYIIDGNILRFDFQHIQLPDSGANQMLSHGFVVYEISPKQNLVNGTQLKNTAAIYFDWNPAVITNTTLNTINIALGVNQLAKTSTTIFPNPVTDKITIEFEKPFEGSIELYDLSGRTVLTENFKGMKFTANLNQLISGMYILIIKNKEGVSVRTEKIVKE